MDNAQWLRASASGKNTHFIAIEKAETIKGKESSKNQRSRHLTKLFLMF